MLTVSQRPRRAASSRPRPGTPGRQGHPAGRPHADPHPPPNARARHTGRGRRLHGRAQPGREAGRAGRRGPSVLAGDLEALVDEIEELLTGTRPAVEVDRVLATVLFTDIMGSTERAGALGTAGGGSR